MAGDYRSRLAVKLLGTPLPQPDSPEAKSYRNMIAKAAKVMHGAVESEERAWTTRRAIVSLVSSRAYMDDAELLDTIRALYADAMRWQGCRLAMEAPPTPPAR